MKKQLERSLFFTHVNGFGDDSLAMEVRGKRAWLHTKRGRRLPGYGKLYPLEYCLKCVCDGVWKKIKAPRKQKRNKRANK
jgi:hypothetical protein